MKLSDPNLALVRHGTTSDVARLCALGGRVEASGDDVGLICIAAGADTRPNGAAHGIDTVSQVPMPWTLIRLGRRRVLVVAQPPGEGP